MLFYLLDVRVQDDIVEIFGYEQGKRERTRLVHQMGRHAFCPEVVLRVDRLYSDTELRPLFESMESQVEKIQCAMKYKLRYFQCEDNGEPKKYPFLTFYTKSMKAWSVLTKGKEAAIVDRCSAHNVRVIGERKDGERQYGDGRLCNNEQGNGLNRLAHQFLRWSRLVPCTWHDIDIESGGAPRFPVEKEVDQAQQVVKPDMPVASFDIETVNTLKICLTPAKKTVKILKTKHNFKVVTNCYSHYFLKITPAFEAVSAAVQRSSRYRSHFSVSYNSDVKHTLRVKKGDSFVIECRSPFTDLESTENLAADDTSFEFVFYFRDESQISATNPNRINARTIQSLQSVWTSHISVGKDDLQIKAWHSSQPMEQAITDIGEIADKISDDWMIHLADASDDGTTTYSDLLKFNGFPDPTHALDEIVCISWVERLYSTQEKVQSTILMVAPKEDQSRCATEDENKIICFDCEGRLLRWFFTKVIANTESGIMMGYNTHGFDTPYIFSRLQRCFSHDDIVNFYKLFWRNTPPPSDPRQILPIIKASESSQRGQTLFCTVQPPAIFDVDLCVWLRRRENHPKKDGEEISLKLDNVAEHFLQDNKHDISFKDINRHWYHEGEDASNLRIRAALYCEQDSDLVVRLANCSQINMLEFNLTLSRIMAVLPRLMPMNNVGEMERLRPFLYEAAFRRDTVIDQPSESDVSKMSYKYQGGIVFDAAPGEHGKFCDKIGEFMWEWALAILDYKSLYPSTMIAYNLSYDTSIELGEHGSFVPSFKRPWERGIKYRKYKIIVDRRLVDSSDGLGHNDIISGVLELSDRGVWTIKTAAGEADVKINETVPNRSDFFMSLEKFGINKNDNCGLILSQRDEAEGVSDERRLELMEKNCHQETLPDSVLPFRSRILSCIESILDRCVPKSVTRVADGNTFALFCAFPESTDVHICESGNELKSAFVQVQGGQQRGIVPEMLRVMLDARVKKKQEKKRLPPELQATVGCRLDLEQLAIKVQTNSIYGASARMEGMKCFPAATTSESRLGLLRAKTYAEARGQEVMYGDTDSIFPKMATPLRRQTVRETLSQFPDNWFLCDFATDTDRIDNWENFCSRDMAVVDPDLDHQLEFCDFSEGMELLQKKLTDEGLNEHVVTRIQNEQDFDDMKEEAAELLVCYRCWKAIRAAVFAFWQSQARCQTAECREPNELEHENMVLNMEFFKNTKKCYVGMVAENPKDTPHMYFKGLSMVKGDCIHVSRLVQALVYNAKYQPHKLRAKCSSVDADEANTLPAWELCRKEIVHLFAPLLSGNVDDNEFYTFCERMLTMRKTMKAEKSYDNPSRIAQVVARRSIVESDPSLACAIGEKQGIIFLRPGTYTDIINGVSTQTKITKRNDGAVDPRVLRLRRHGDRVDFAYYVKSCFKALKGGENLRPGNMNRTTFVQLKPVFQFLLDTAEDRAKRQLLQFWRMQRTRIYTNYVNARAFADCESELNPTKTEQIPKRKQSSLLDMLSKKPRLKKNHVK